MNDFNGMIVRITAFISCFIGDVRFRLLLSFFSSAKMGLLEARVTNQPSSSLLNEFGFGSSEIHLRIGEKNRIKRKNQIDA